jgi:hypothetical protein
MNWTGFPLLAIVLTPLGCLGGMLCYAWLYGSMGITAPWVIALCAGVPAALASHDRSVMRGLIVATIVVWAAAAAQGMHVRSHGALEALMSFHQYLDLRTFTQLTVAAAVATLIGSRSVRTAPAAADDR